MKSKTLSAMLGLGLCFFLSACQKEAMVEVGLNDENEAAIRKVVEEYLVLTNAAEKDHTALVEHYYAKDATVLAPNMPSVTGHAALVSFFEEFPPYENFKLEIVELDGQGDLAYVWGTYAMDIMLPETEMAMHDVGKYVEVWKKQADGNWKVHLDIFNTDLPMTTSEIEEEK